MEKHAKEHPILFSGPLVRAILDGRKTQTRRLIRLPEGYDLAQNATMSPRQGIWWEVRCEPWATVVVRCPFGVPGDRLWVREAWRVGAWRADGRFALDYAAGPTERTPWLQPPPEVGARLAEQSVYDCARAKAAGDTRIREEGDRYVWGVGDSPCRWRPSIHMPRWASRINLEVTEVRVQRVQDITEEDARAEGLPLNWVGEAAGWTPEKSGWLTPAGYAESEECCEGGTISGKPAVVFSAREALQLWWDHINGERAGGSWKANPWVWAVSFKRLNGGSDV